jgi:uncharacterized cysteine cluster protein YcgN (CxxCxxCC family)
MGAVSRFVARVRARWKCILEARRKKREWWEALCKQCGLCCYDWELRRGKLIIHKESPCPYLDTATKLCTVYERRFRVCPECAKMTRFKARYSRRVPETCGYAEYFRGKRAPRRGISSAQKSDRSPRPGG